MILKTTLFLLLFTSAVAAQSKKELLINKWSYSGKEEFGVVRPPDASMKDDFIEIKADGSFAMIKEGKQATGTWTMNEKAAIIVFTHSKTKKTFSYTLKNVDDKQLVIEYQTPDLVRTKYHYRPAE
ncbi:MAG TPA: hypothetical protein PLD84_09770 [Chitinophagales bacterium]|nr:hypothetical protein [Chitinophagales bacterium]